MFDSHNQVVDSHCLLKSKTKILCLVYLYSCNNFLQTTCQICCLLQRAKFDFNQEYFKKYEEKHDTNTFSEEQFMEILFLKVSFCFPSAKSNKQGGKVFLRKFGVFQGKILRPCLFFENTRKILINEYPLGNIMCIGNF